MEIKARDLRPGTLVKMPSGQTATVKLTKLRDGSDGAKPMMAGGDDLKSAYVLEVQFDDHETVIVHPAVEVPLA